MRRSVQLHHCGVNHLGQKMRKGFIPLTQNEPRGLNSGIGHGATL